MRDRPTSKILKKIIDPICCNEKMIFIESDCGLAWFFCTKCEESIEVR